MTRMIQAFLIAVLSVQPAIGETDSETIQLKDGSALHIDKKGDMTMKDSNGRSLRMPDGIPMETQDGRVIMMHNNELWQRLTQHGTLNPKFNP